MTDLIPTWLAVALFAAAGAGVAAVVIYQRLKRQPRPPAGWTHLGAPPLDVVEALEVLRQLCPGIRWGGTIQWVDTPWRLPYDGALAPGQVLDYQQHRIRVLRLEPVEASALAHEIDHLRRQSSTETLESQAWVARANAAIRERTKGA